VGQRPSAASRVDLKGPQAQEGRVCQGHHCFSRILENLCGNTGTRSTIAAFQESAFLGLKISAEGVTGRDWHWRTSTGRRLRRKRTNEAKDPTSKADRYDARDQGGDVEWRYSGTPGSGLRIPFANIQHARGQGRTSGFGRRITIARQGKGHSQRRRENLTGDDIGGRALPCPYLREARPTWTGDRRRPANTGVGSRQAARTVSP